MVFENSRNNSVKGLYYELENLDAGFARYQTPLTDMKN